MGLDRLGKVSRSAAQVHFGLFKEALEASRASRREAFMPRENGRVALEWGNEVQIRLARGDLEGASRALDRGLGPVRTHGNVAVLASLLTNRILVSMDDGSPVPGTAPVAGGIALSIARGSAALLRDPRARTGSCRLILPRSPRSLAFRQGGGKGDKPARLASLLC